MPQLKGAVCCSRQAWWQENEAAVTLHLCQGAEREREREMNAGVSSLSPFDLVWDPSLYDGVASIYSVFSHLD